MNKVLTRGIITIAAVNDGKDGHSLTAKAFIEGSYRNGRTKGVKSYVKVFYDGQEVKDFTVSYRYKGAGQADWVKPQTNKEDYWVDAQRDGSTLFVEYVVEYKGLTAVATGRLDNIQDGRDAVGYALVPFVEKVVAYLTDDKMKWVDVELVYRVRKSVGERVSFVTDLAAEDMTLRVSGGLGGFKAHNGVFGLHSRFKYEERPHDSYAVTLTKGVILVDRRVLPITFKPKVVFEFGEKVDGIDGKIDGIAGKVSTLDGRVSGFETTIDHFRTEVKDKVSHSELKQTADGIAMKVGSSVNANLLWGSDLDLSQVQDVINRAYAQGDIIKKKTEEKAEWKRSRDNASSDDDRMRYQEGMDACDREIAQAQGEVAKFRAAIGKRLGVVISGGMEIGNEEMFEYLKGEGVGGSDAIHFKNVYKREGWAKWTNLGWNDVPLKPNTKYTISVWVKFKSYGRKGRMYVDSASDDGRYCFGGYLYKEHYYDRADIDEWQRVRYVFDSGASKRLSGLFFSCIADEEEGAQCEIWLCRPKLEEGKVATPWCAYDGTVDALLAGGFDVKEKKFTVTSDNFVVQNNRGEQTFMVDENGRINNGMLTSRLRLTEPTIITKENYKEFCYNGKLNGHNVLFLDLLKCGTLLVLTDVPEQLFLDLPSFKYFKSYNTYTQKEVAKEQYDKMRYIGNTIILYNIDSHNVYVSGVLKYKKMEGTHDYGNLDEFGFYALDRMSCTSSVLTCFECKFGITKPEKSQPWFYRKGGVYWDFCCVTIT